MGTVPLVSTRSFREAELGKKRLLSGVLGSKYPEGVCKNLALIVTGKALQEFYAAQQKQEPGKNFTDMANEDLLMVNTNVMRGMTA